MSTSVAILLAVVVLSLAAFALKRRDSDPIWTIARDYSLDSGVYEFTFRISFDNLSSAEEFQHRLKHPSVSTRIEISPNRLRWVVLGDAKTRARGAWYRAILCEWTEALDGLIGAGETIVAMASKPGVGTGFFLSTDLADAA